MSNILNAFLILDDVSIQHKVGFNAVGALGVHDVADLVKEVNSIIPPMQYPGDNPNNGQPFHTFTIGKEFSRVVYVNVVKAYRKDINYEKLTKELRAVGKAYHADENDLHENTDGIFIWRFWWD